MAESDALPPDYRILQTLDGPGGRTFRAADATGRAVFLKRARTPRAGLREARALRALRVPFFPSLYGVRRRGGHVWLAMEWLNGGPLSEAIAAPPDWPTSLARVLVFLHRARWVHGDLKPENVWIEPDGRVRLIDFDFALPTGDELDFEESGATRGYVAPERLSGWPADPRSDLFAFGTLLERLGPPGWSRAVESLRLRRPAPSERPARLDTVVPDLVRLCGPGHALAPELDYAGWYRGETMQPEPLGRGLERYLGLPPLEAGRVADALWNQTGGHRGYAARLLDAWLPATLPDPFAASVPGHVSSELPRLTRLARALVEERFQRLPPACRRALGELAWLAPMIRPIDVAGGLTCAQDTPPGHAPLLARLVREGFLEHHDDGAGEENWRFRAPPLRHHARDILTESQRRELHTRMLAHLERIRPGERHFDHDLHTAAQLAGLGRHEAAAWLYLDTAHERLRAHRSGALVEPFEAGFRALRAAFPEPDPPPSDAGVLALWPSPSGIAALRRRDALGGLASFASALALAGRREDGLVWIDRVLELDLPPALRAMSHQVAAEISQLLRRIADTERHVRLGLAIPEVSPSTRARLVTNRAQMHLGQGELTTAATDLTIAVEQLRAAGDTIYECVALMLGGNIAFRKSDYAGARDRWDESLRLAGHAGNAAVVSGGLYNLAAAQWYLGDRSAARQTLARCLRVAGDARLGSIALDSLTLLASFARMENRPEEALTHLTTARKLALEQRDRRLYAGALATLGQVQSRVGRLGEAERLLEELRTQDFDESTEDEERRILFVRSEIRVWLRRLPAEPAAQRRLEVLVRTRDLPRDQLRLSAHEAAHHLLSGGPPEEARQLLGAKGQDPELSGWWRLALSRILDRDGDPGGALVETEAARADFAAAGHCQFERCFAGLERTLLTLKGDERLGLASARDSVLEARALGARWIEAQALRLCRRSSDPPGITPGTPRRDGP